MRQITITTSPQIASYTITVKDGALRDVGQLLDLHNYSKIFVVTDANVEASLLGTLLMSLPAGTQFVSLTPGESQKQIDTIQRLWQAMHAAELDRKSLLINLGGGVIGDVGGFAASTYMRGIDFVNIPTTLLAQVDSSVGGKNGINFDGVKNLIGAFCQPIGVIIDPQTLAQLPNRQLTAGFAEIVKHGLIHDKTYFDQVTSKSAADFSSAELEEIIARSCEIKVAIIESDIAEEGQRKLVNYGHTVGHALEALQLDSDTPLLHGEAVSIGMMAEARIAVAQGLLSEDNLGLIKQRLASVGLPTAYEDLDTEEIIAKMKTDKKNSGGQIKFVLLERIGHAVYDQQVPESVIIAALEQTRKKS